MLLSSTNIVSYVSHYSFNGKTTSRLYGKANKEKWTHETRYDGEFFRNLIHVLRFQRRPAKITLSNPQSHPVDGKIKQKNEYHLVA